MNIQELRTDYEAACKIIQRERAMRVSVFRNRPQVQSQKVAEIDELQEIVTRMKDELKTHMEPEPEQAVLL